MPREITLTKKEQRFIERLRKLLDGAPGTLWMFGWSGSLHIGKEDATGHPCSVASSFSMACDGGDPTSEVLDADVEVEYE